MKAMMLTGKRQMEMMEVPMPKISSPNDVLIKIKTVAVCGSDVHYYLRGKIGSQVVSYPFPVGHECAGEVVGTGSGVSKVKVGDRIAVEPAMSCGKCDQCLAGRPHTCRKIRFLGCPEQAEGSMQEYIVMPQECCFPVPKTLTFDQAAISEPYAIAVYAVRQSLMEKGLNVGILGYGPIGMSVSIAARAKGAGKLFVTDKIEGRIAIAKNNGVAYAGNVDKTDVVKEIYDSEPAGMDIVFECCGKQEAIENAIDLLKPGGKLMVIGIPEFDKWQFPVDKCRHKEITIVNVRRQNHALEEALDDLVTGRADVSQMPTHRFSFEKSREAFELVAEYADGVMKAMIDF